MVETTLHAGDELQIDGRCGETGEAVRTAEVATRKLEETTRRGPLGGEGERLVLSWPQVEMDTEKLTTGVNSSLKRLTEGKG